MIISVSKSKQNIACSVLEEENFLIDYLKLQERINANLSSYFKQFVNNNSSSDFNDSKKLYNDISPIYKMLGKSFTNIDSIHSLQKKLDAIDLSIPDYLKKIENYNAAYIKVFDKVVKETTSLEQYLFELSKNSIEIQEEISVETPEENSAIQAQNIVEIKTVAQEKAEEIAKEENVIKDPITAESVTTLPGIEAFEENVDLEDSVERTNPVGQTSIESFAIQASDKVVQSNSNTNIESQIDENTLLVSEPDNKVVLPFTLDTIEKLMQENPDKYKKVNDVIDDLYTKPLKYYRHSSFMRFKEAYDLVRHRSNGSIMQALDLGLELFSNYNLHPAIISACKNLDELDIYLSCLQYNELNDFHFFKTIFKINPLLQKKKI